MVNCELHHFPFSFNELARKYTLDTSVTAVVVHGILNKFPL